MPEPSFDERVSILSLSDNITKYIETDIHKWVFQVKKDCKSMGCLFIWNISLVMYVRLSLTRKNICNLKKKISTFDFLSVKTETYLLKTN